jgi:hypothetical protein
VEERGLKRAGVSEVIGTLILVGVVVLGMALVGLLLLANPTPSNIPAFDSIISNRSKTIYIYHRGGDALWPGQYKILVDGADQTANFTIMSPGSVPWSVGETLTASYPGMPATSMPKQVVMIYNTSMGGGTILVVVDLNKGVTPAPAFVQVATNYTTSGRILPITFTGTSTSGNLIVVSTDWANQALGITSITDSKGNAYLVAAGPTTVGATAKGVTYYARNIIGGGSPIQVTITLSGVPGASPSFEAYVTEYSGIQTANPLDQAVAGSGAGLALDSGYRTTTQASELIYGYAWTDETATPTPPLIMRSNYRGNFVADRTVSAIANLHVTGTNDLSASWICQMVTFKGG